MKRSVVTRMGLGLWVFLILFGGICPDVLAYEYVDVRDQVAVTTANERSVLDRRTRKITSTVDITLTHTSEQAIALPLHAVVEINGADVSLVQMPGTLGGAGTAPYNTYYFEISPASFSPGQTHTFTATFIYPSSVRFTYMVIPYAMAEPENAPPTADAGPDRSYTLPEGQTEMDVVLDGSGSNDPDGAIHTYQWTGAPDPEDVAQPSLTLTEGSYTFTLVVTDDDGEESAPDTVTIVINPSANHRPVADAGEDIVYTLSYGQTEVKAVFDGGGSFDEDGTITGYAWSGLPDPEDVQEPAVILTPGTYVFTLVVTDDQGAQSNPDTVTVTIHGAQVGSPPILSIDPLVYTVSEGETLSFSLSATDPDDQKVTLSAFPKITNSAFTSASGNTATGTFTFQPDMSQQGIQVVSFRATDPMGLSDTKTVQIHVTDINRPPTLSGPSLLQVKEGQLLNLKVEATDPDDDLLTVTVMNLPQNALFVPATGTITFAPDFDQSGTYAVTCQANDGELDSDPLTISIEVVDVPIGDPGQPSTLDLQVNPPESPTLQQSARITGTVNASSSAPPLPRITSALITAMNPSQGEQGQTLEVVLTGQAAGDFPTHFQQDLSQAQFGEGITIHSLTVTDEREARANITIRPTTETGSRPVRITTGNEVAVSLMAFTVTRGNAGVEGRLIDPDTGLPLAGAVVTVSGTTITTTTLADGSFLLPDVPSGAQTLLINALDHELVTLNVDTSLGETVHLGEIPTETTVFNPGNAPSVSLPSIIGRGFAETSGRISLKEAKALIQDCWLLVGGVDAGVMDAYGNQLNPNIQGEGQISLTPSGIDKIARKLLSGDTMTLHEILYAFSNGFDWNGTPPPSLLEWVTALQEVINEAWENPMDEDSHLAILLFNRGRTLSPVPPVINFETRLNALQANLLVASFMIYALDPAGNLETRATKEPVRLAFNGVIPPGFLFVQAVNPGVQGRKSTMRHFWKNYFTKMANWPLGTIAVAIGAGVAMATTVCAFGGHLGQVVAMGVAGVAVGVLAELALQSLVSLNLMTLVPDPPMPLLAESFESESGKRMVKVTFHRSIADRDHIEMHNNKVHFYYTLYRYEVSPYNIMAAERLEDLEGVAVANFCTNCPESYPGIPRGAWDLMHEEKNVLEMWDPDPIPGKINYYDLTLTRLVGNIELAGGDEHLGSTFMWWGSGIPGFCAPLTTGLVPTSRDMIGPGMVMTATSPAYTLAEGIKKLTSDFSGMVAAYAGELPPVAADEIEIDQADGLIYYSDLGKKQLIRVEWPGDNSVNYSLLANTGFKDPGQIGLGIDSHGNLLTDNRASDSLYGGRVFRFTKTGQKELFGTVNYFSQLLMYAHPCSVSRMVVGEYNDLYVVDEISSSVIRIPAWEDWPEEDIAYFGRHGALYTPNISGNVMDMEFDKDWVLHLLTLPDMQRIVPFGGHGNLEESLHIHDDLDGGIPGGMEVDGYGNIYISIKGGTSGPRGRILMYPKDRCESDNDCEPITIMEGLEDPGDIELSQDGRALFIASSKGGLTRRFFGVSGYVRDFFGNPLQGASVSIKTTLGTTPTCSTDAQGFFSVPDVFRSDLVGSFIDIIIEYNKKYQTMVTYLGQPNGDRCGQTIREITFN